MIIGYARVSTDDQDLSLQVSALEEAGCERIYSDKKSGKDMRRPGWRKCRMDLRGGDTLVVWKLDRLGRSLVDLVETVAEFRDEGIGLVVVTQSIDTRTAAGRFMFNILASLAEMERELISERTKAGIEQARERGFVPGPIPRITPEIWDYAVKAFKERPKLTIPALCRMIHEDVQQGKGKPLTPGSIHNVLGELKAGNEYPEHWRMRIKQAADRKKEARRQARQK